VRSMNLENGCKPAVSRSGRPTGLRVMSYTTAMRFVDTNILLYSVSTDPDERDKTIAAAEILDAEDLCLSVQVLQEFYVQATRPARSSSLTHEDATAFIEKWLRFPVQEMTLTLMQAAFAASRRWKVSYWDAAIVEAARMLGCAELLSEDLSAGQDFGGLRVVNPYSGPGVF
jgi:predicted nucleic acid-binding protein